MKTKGKKKKSNPNYDRIYSKCSGSKGTYIARLKNIGIPTSELLDSYSEVMNDAYRYAFARIQDNEALNPLKTQCI